MGNPEKKRSPLVKFMDDFASYKPTTADLVFQVLVGSYLAINFAAAGDAYQTTQTNDIAQKNYDAQMADYKIAQEEFDLAYTEYYSPKAVFESKSIIVEEDGKAKTQMVDSSGVTINIVTTRTHGLEEEIPEEVEPFTMTRPDRPAFYTAPAEWQPQTAAESIVLPGRFAGKALYQWTHQPS